MQSESGWINRICNTPPACESMILSSTISRQMRLTNLSRTR